MFKKHQYIPAIAKELKNSDKAFMIEYMVWSVKEKRLKPDYYKDCFKDGLFYMWDTYKVWHQRMPWLGESTIRKYIAQLRDDEWYFHQAMACK